MSDGILLAPYPVLNYNPFVVRSDVPEHRVTFDSSTNNGREALTATKTTLTTETNQAVSTNDAEFSAALELKKQKYKDRHEEIGNHKAAATAEVDYIKQGQTCLLAMGAVFAFLALAAAAVAFGTPEWRVYDVNENAAKPINNPSAFICTNDTTVTTCQFYTTRRRGLFVTCYRDSSFFSIVYSSNKLASSWLNGERCVWEQKYNLQSTPITTVDNCDQDPSIKNGRAMVNMNSNIMRTQWVAFAIAIIFLTLGLLFSLVSCCEIRVCGSMFAGVIVLIAILFLLLSMILFHVYIYMEEENLRCPPFYGVLKKDIFSNVYKNTQVYYGFSFYLGWFSIVPAILASAFLLAAACQRRASQAKINKAMYRLSQIAKEERAEKKYEEMEEKRKRKELEKLMRKESKAKSKTPSESGSLSLRKKKKSSLKKIQMNVSDSEIDYDIKKDVKSLKKEKQRRLKELREATEEEIAGERNKFKAKKNKDLKELERAERELEEVEMKVKALEKKKKEKERRRRMEEDSTTDDGSDSDNPEIRKKSKHRHRKRCRSCDSTKSSGSDKWSRIDRKCGIVVRPPAMGTQHQSCCDPYTLHLPTGFQPPPYRP